MPSTRTSSSPQRGPRGSLGGLLLLTALVICGTTLLVVVPPGGEPSVDASAASVEAHGIDADTSSSVGASTVEILAEGDQDAVAVEGLRYDFEGELPRYTLELEQRMQTTTGETESEVVTRLEAVLLLEQAPDPGALVVSVERFDVSITSNGEAVDIPAVNTLLRGVAVEVEVDATTGLGDEDAVASNPQVKRMAMLLIDALRQAHPALPDHERAAVGTSWRTTSDWSGDDSGRASLTATHTLGEATETDASVMLRSSYALTLQDGEVRGGGEGQADHRFELSSGHVSSSTGWVEYTQHSAASGDGSGRRVRRLEWSIRAGQ